MKASKTTKAKLTRNETISDALAVLRSEYFRQLAVLAEELRVGFEAGIYGAEIDLTGADGENPHLRLLKAVRERLGGDEALQLAVVAASPNNKQALDPCIQIRGWRDAAEDAVLADLLVIAEANGWARWRLGRDFLPFAPRPVAIAGGKAVRS